jgi:hypothetical protein
MFPRGQAGRGICALIAVVAIFAVFSATSAHASATLLLEEPYGKLGFFTATGHAAVYLSGVCAETPVKLRPCRPGELGAVISRYDGVGRLDWVAIPLIPYLYAVEKPEEIPLFVDSKVVSFLRNQYRQQHLEMVAPDLSNGEAPGGNWYELVGTAYDRTSYAYEIETSPERDADFIEAYNAGPNVSHFRTVSHNCADFAKDVINFYYPKALHRSVIADVGITTPKQMAKTLVKYSSRHPDLEFTRYVIPQVPGSEARSTPVHGVVESFLKSKKYIVPSAVASPIFAGSVLAVYEGTGTGRFDPSRQELVYSAQRGLEPRIDEEDRRSYQLELSHLMVADLNRLGQSRVQKTLSRTLNASTPGFDADGRPMLRLSEGDETENFGITRVNLLTAEPASGRFAQELLEARLREELRKGNPAKVSESDVERDWNLLQKTLKSSDEQVASGVPRAVPSSTQARWGNSSNRP